MKRDRKPGRNPRRPESTSITPLDAEKRRLQEEAARLYADIERKKDLIKRAPELKAKAEKRRREELVTRAARTEARFGSPGALIDPRHGLEANVGAVVRERKLRKHRRQGMWTFFVLCSILVTILYWVWTTLVRGLIQ
jgi:hypothetical protein